MDTIILSKRLKELRQNLNITQKEFAKTLNITAAALSKYESGNGYPSIPILAEIAKKYNVSVDWLLGLSENNTTTTEVTNYSDLIQPIVTLTKSKKLQKIISLEYNIDNEEWALIFHRGWNYLDKDKLDSLFKQYKNILDLYVAKTIDDSIFNAVIEKLEKDFEIEINNNLSFFKLRDN